MPFDSSYIDHDKTRYFDSQDFLVSIAKKIVRNPLSTHVIKTVARSGKIRFLIVDRSRAPEEGDLVLAAASPGLRLGRVKRAASMKNIWGTVIWFLEEA